MHNQCNATNPDPLLDRVNRFEQFTQAEQARDLFSEISELLQHDGHHAMSEFINHISMCYDDIDGQDHQNLGDYTTVALTYFRRYCHNITPTPAEISCAIRCTQILPEAVRPSLNALTGQEPAPATP